MSHTPSSNSTDESLERPTFIALLLRYWGRTYAERGILALFPAWITLCLLVGAAVSYLVPDEFWQRPDRNIPTFAAILTFNGILMALSWNAFAKIIEIISAPPFCVYLKEKCLFEDYLFHINYINFTQSIAALSALLGLIAVNINFSYIEYVKYFALTTTVATTIYSIKEALGAVTILNDLIWNRAIFESNRRAQIRSVSNGS